MSRLTALRSRLPAPFSVVVLAALAAIPLIYSSALIGANQNPTGNLDAIPAVVVNADHAAEVASADGTTRQVGFGDELATELLGSDSRSNFTWTSATADEAAAALADGSVFAVLDIPADFSTAVASGLTVDAGAASAAQRAVLTITTDDSANYVTGNIAKTIGTALVDELDATIRQGYLEDLYLGFTDLHDSVTAAADGATELASGLGELADGVAPLPSGLAQLSAGSSSAVAGAGSLSSGLGTLSTGAGGVSDGLDRLIAGYASLDDAQRLALLQQLDAGAHAVASGSAEASAGASTLQSGLGTLSAGLGELSASAPAVVNGVGAARAGADTLAAELAAGADDIPAFDATSAAQLSEIAGTPVELVAVRAHAVTGYGAGLAPYFLALGLWIGAIGTFLMRPALSARLLDRRRNPVVVALGSYLPNAALAIVQALLATLTADAVLPIDAVDLPGLALVAVLASLAFMAIVQALIAVLGPTGRFFALVLTVLQVTAAGGTYPVQTAPVFFQVLHGILPMSHAMQAFRSLISGGALGIATAVPALLIWLVAALGVTTLAAVRAGRRAVTEGAAAVVAEEDEPAIA
jgi:putative membrane protein